MRLNLVCWICLVLLFGSANPLIIVAHDDEDAKSVNNSAGANPGNAPPTGNGFGNGYDSHNINLLGHLWLHEIGNLNASNIIGNDIWGWTDAASGREFALMGLTNRTSFIEVTDPTAPVYLGSLKTTPGTGNRAWRDIKIYNEQAYIVSDGNGAHGLQVFDLTQLLTASPSSTTSPHYFSSVGVYNGFTSAHNVIVNEDSGYAYVVGANVASGGLHVLDLNGGSDGAMPTFAGNFSADGYTHDAQVVNYIGPDSDYVNAEIAFNCNEDTLTIVDVTDKSNMTQISRVGYSGSEYSHQGWLSEDQHYFFMDDELDEYRADELIKTRTRVWDVSNLDAPVYLGYHDGERSTIDHNLYVKGDYIYQANYTSGFRMLKINDAATLDLEEWGYFDTYMDDDNVNFNGAWSVFPFFESGTILVSDRQNGLFVLSAVEPPEILDVVVQDGTPQRSMVAELGIVMSGPVELEEDAITVMQRNNLGGVTGTAVDISVETSALGDDTWVSVSFNDTTRPDTGTLLDGNYQLTIDPTKVLAAGSSVAMEQEFVFGDEAADNFFCFFGDFDGNRTLSLSPDRVEFRPAIRTRDGDSKYSPYFDYDSDGEIDIFERVKFRMNFGKTLSFDSSGSKSGDRFRR